MVALIWEITCYSFGIVLVYSILDVFQASGLVIGVGVWLGTKGIFLVWRDNELETYVAILPLPHVLHLMALPLFI